MKKRFDSKMLGKIFEIKEHISKSLRRKFRDSMILLSC